MSHHDDAGGSREEHTPTGPAELPDGFAAVMAQMQSMDKHELRQRREQVEQTLAAYDAYAAAREYLERGEYEDAARWLQIAAGNGVAEAQRDLDDMALRSTVEDAVYEETSAAGAQAATDVERALAARRAPADPASASDQTAEPAPSDWQQAENSLHRLRGRYLRAHGPHDPLTLAAVVGLAQAMLAIGKPGEAEEELASNVWRLREIFGQHSPLYLRALFLLGQAAAQQGDYRLARERYEIAFTGQQQLLGSDHPETLHTQLELGIALKMMGDRARAAEMIRSVRNTAQAIAPRTDLYARAVIGMALVHLPASVWRLAAGRKARADQKSLQPLIDQIDQIEADAPLEDLQEVLDQVARHHSQLMLLGT
ncbi:tetratricopeptide repeat protein [Streptomyces sp. NPDC086082]|uniref:tetratricopeptide repeat protein n=1 Tax=Streptomyces sp. NPDC086082 TaxID=3365750 RepID=UPI0038187E15